MKTLGFLPLVNGTGDFITVDERDMIENHKGAIYNKADVMPKVDEEKDSAGTSMVEDIKWSITFDY